MQRLLKDAEAISGVHYDIENYSDVVSAIHEIQNEMGITGTTAREAASTISGSWGMLQSSWDNLLVSIAGGGDDISVAVKNVFDSLATYIANVVPRFLVAIRGIFEALPMAIATALDRIPEIVDSVIRSTFGDGMADSVLEMVNPIVESARTLVNGVLSTVGTAWGYIKEFSGGLISALGGKLPSVLSALVPAVQNVVKIFATKLCAAMRAVTVLVEPLASVFNGLVNVLSSVWDVVADVSTAFFDSLLDGIEQIDMGSFGEDFESFADVAASAIEGLKGPLIEVATFIGTGIGQAIAALGPVVAEFGSWLVGTAAPAVTEFANTVGAILGPALAEFGAWIMDTAIPAVTDFATSVGETLGPVLSDIGEWFATVAGPALADFGTWIMETAVPAVTEFASAVGETLGPILSDLGQWISDRAKDFGKFMDKIGEVADWFGARFKDIQDAFSSIKFEWPKLTLPHFGISPAGWQIGDLLSGVIPSLSIEWYARGGLFNEPTVMLPGVGDAGTELAWPGYEPYLSKYAAAIARYMPSGAGTTVNNIYLDGKLLGTDARIDDRVMGLLEDLRRLGACNVG